ncbi:receptor-like protein, putative [Medicago truncatula]|uniref:Receptor-like protein, putative n=1 Tax=Medicago truncatula TaxID=3880 RepID=G7JN84_MEDTR|nr:receptor-like protein, putative [Medicago truncatula]
MSMVYTEEQLPREVKEREREIEGGFLHLEFLDLSRNRFIDRIPHLGQIDRLSLLNLSGRIPIGWQLQSFDASSYEGNVDLSGKPLDNICQEDEEIAPQKPETFEESSPEDMNSIYLSVALGFITGFWGLWGSLLFIRNWRQCMWATNVGFTSNY